VEIPRNSWYNVRTMATHSRDQAHARLQTNRVEISEIVRIIRDKYGPVEKIILFGSHARGDADEHSDLDLIIIKETDKRFVARLVEVPSLPVHADVFVYTPEEFDAMKENENPFIMNALESAKVIYERGENP